MCILSSPFWLCFLQDELLYDSLLEYGPSWAFIAEKIFKSSRTADEIKERQCSSGFRQFVIQKHGQKGYDDIPQSTANITEDASKRLRKHESAVQARQAQTSFTPEEDEIIRIAMGDQGQLYENWADIRRLMPHHTSKGIRERWTNYLRPGIDVSPFSEEEVRVDVRT